MTLKRYSRLRDYITNLRMNKAFSDKEKMHQRGWFFVRMKQRKVKR